MRLNIRGTKAGLPSYARGLLFGEREMLVGRMHDGADVLDEVLHENIQFRFIDSHGLLLYRLLLYPLMGEPCWRVRATGSIRSNAYAWHGMAWEEQ